MSDETEFYTFEGVLFEWHRPKAATNLRKHGLSIAEGASVFGDEDAILIPDPDHSEEESRFLLLGQSRLRRVLVVVSVERGERLRIISVRQAVRKERSEYEEERKNRRG